ncbi:MAG: cytochrome B [Gammaproteobacteria bacterium HGW-Gammaproteobacteria-4]|nr:MAG: cytochrome B [Gammaproteobacteria bacterium HGW-Gammaproteobacteria-4]
MQLRNSNTRWGAVSQFLHWLILGLVLVMAVLGLTMTDLPNGIDKIKTYALHKSIGISVLALMLLRLLWRAFAGPAPTLSGPHWQRRMASLAHGVLYALMLAIPLSGWAFNSAANFALRWFGWFNLPRLVPADPRLKAVFHEAHEWLFWILVAVVVLHAAAALKHHFVDRDGVLMRMLPWFRTKKDET